MQRLLAAFFVMAAVLAIPSAASATAIKTADFETGDLTQWASGNAQACSATVYSAAGQPTWPTPDQSTYAMRFLVEANDVLTGGTMDCNAASGAPRGQIFGSNATASGSVPLSGDYWYSFSWYDPSSGGVPAVTGSDFYVVQQDFGNPFSGSPPVGIDLKDTDSDGTNEIVMDACHDGCGSVTRFLNGPAVRKDHWYRIKVHKVMSTSDVTGSVEVWIDGAKQTFTTGSQTYNTRTLHSGCTCTSTDAYRAYLNSYRSSGLTASSITTYFDAFKSGTTRTDVERAPVVASTGAIADANWATNTSKTFSANVQKGDTLVVLGAQDELGNAIAPTASGETFTNRANASSANYDAAARLYDATITTTNASLTVTCNTPAAQAKFGCSYAVLRYSGGYDANGTFVGDTTANYDNSITTSQAHEFLAEMNTDANGTASASTWSSMSKIKDAWSSGNYSAYSAYRSDVTSAGAATVSQSAPSAAIMTGVGGAYFGN